MIIRTSTQSDIPALERLYPQAFPDEDLLPLLRDLLAEAGSPGYLSLVADREGDPIGHIFFAPCGMDAANGRWSLLAPLAVSPPEQRRGIGKALIQEGLRRLGEAGVERVFVLGDPAYYGRSGFTAEDRVLPPHAIPADWVTLGAWQSLWLADDVPDAKRDFAGRLWVPAVWDNPRWWAE